jgi:hypothetical protein
MTRKKFSRDRTFVLRREIPEDIGQLGRERSQQCEEVGMKLMEIGRGEACVKNSVVER